MRYFQIIIFLSLAYSMVGQQHCAITLQGFITNREDQKALSYASVFILETGQYALSNDNGSWQIDNVCPGKYHIKIDHLGCESQSIFASIQNDTSIVVILEHHVELLSVVDVTDSRLPQSSTKANYEVSGKYLARLKSQNLGEVAKMIPGVDAIKTGTTIAKPTIHGLSGNRVAIVSDGVMVEGQQWGMDHAPEIDISNTGSVKVIKGSAPILYGSMATAGVIISVRNLAYLRSTPSWQNQVQLSEQWPRTPFGCATFQKQPTMETVSRWSLKKVWRLTNTKLLLTKYWPFRTVPRLYCP
ncbi:MAG TPA: TonB-dependent receptor plug domain-containing protein [Saprospiraceae bacterium]|nr:TonB-dependent receptor plug domain-containing protein [Saprospiraceae bacterium]